MLTQGQIIDLENKIAANDRPGSRVAVTKDEMDYLVSRQTVSVAPPQGAISIAFKDGSLDAANKFRQFAMKTLLELGGGKRGFDSARKNGVCLREPQKSLEEAISVIIKFDPVRDQPRHVEDSPDVFHQLLSSLTNQKDDALTLPRQLVIDLVTKLREYNAICAASNSLFEHLGPLTIENLDVKKNDNLLTALAGLRNQLKELLK